MHLWPIKQVEDSPCCQLAWFCFSKQGSQHLVHVFSKKLQRPDFCFPVLIVQQRQKHTLQKHVLEKIIAPPGIITEENPFFFFHPHNALHLHLSNQTYLHNITHIPLKYQSIPQTRYLHSYHIQKIVGERMLAFKSQKIHTVDKDKKCFISSYNCCPVFRLLLLILVHQQHPIYTPRMTKKI